MNVSVNANSRISWNADPETDPDIKNTQRRMYLQKIMLLLI